VDSAAASELDTLFRTSGDDLPLGRAAALLAAAEQTGVNADEIVASLDALAAPIRIPSGAGSYEAIARINHRLFTELGFTGDREDYYAPHNSFLDKVIERRRGLPILLSIVYLEVARRANVAVRGVGFPGHFIVSPEPQDDEPRFYVDPFHGGAIRRRDQLLVRLEEMRLPPEQTGDFLAPTSNRLILLRMTYNLKGSYVRMRRTRDALRQIDQILALAPERVEEHRDRGLLLIELGELEEAARALSLYLDARPDADDAEPLAHLLTELE
jgi:regulator of sirC expression with transglutaminase-like and TPR domain